jgi:3D (Asp-Asp-Asp) domain-containing protein
MRVTAYCPCRKCCGKHSDDVTACGHKIRHGDTFVAADKMHSFGTEMIIPGYNNSEPVEVLDRGRIIRGNRLDIYFYSHRRAMKWGVKYLTVKIRTR